MIAGTKLLLTEEQSMRPSTAYRAGRISHLGEFVEALWRFYDAMRKGIPLDDAPQTLKQLNASLHGMIAVRLPLLTQPSRFHLRRRRCILTSGKTNGPKVSTVENFKIEVTCVSLGTKLPGWRVTTHDQTTGLQHEFYVLEGQIRHVQFQSSPPWTHSTPFVVGGIVKRIMDSERRAVLHALREFDAGVFGRS